MREAEGWGGGRGARGVLVVFLITRTVPPLLVYHHNAEGVHPFPGTVAGPRWELYCAVNCLALLSSRSVGFAEDPLD